MIEIQRLETAASNNGAMRNYGLILTVFSWLNCNASLAAANDVITEPFQGVRLVHSKAMSPRQVDVWVVEIDTSAPGVSFLVTPSNGDLIGDTTPETTRAFVTRIGAQLGINGSFFSTAAKGPPTKGQYNVSGLSVSNGDAYSPFARGFVDAINISRDNKATIIQGIEKGAKKRAPEKLPKEKGTEINIGLAHEPAVPLYNALSGKTRLVTNGKNVAAKDPAIHPRTGIGIKSDGKLLLFTVDGREKGRSLGMNFSEMADAMIRFGARDAINLDGGGSTTFVMDDPKTPVNDPKLMNLPCDPFKDSKEPGKEHGKERPTGNNLAVFVRK
jgi:hypothetical protein